jgi:hypothetical protein
MEPAFSSRTSHGWLLRVPKLSETNLRQLFSGQIGCLVVTNAVESNAASHIVRRITASQELSGYEIEPRFKKIGKAWFDHQTTQERVDHINRTIEYTTQTRALCAPFPSPTDVLKLDLDLIWKSGAINLRIEGEPIYFGLPRAIAPGGAVEAHFDWIGHDSPGVRGIDVIQSQYAVNFHLQTAEGGGELALWNTDFTPDELRNMRRPDHNYALDEQKIGAPAVIFRPEAGSLVFFNAMQPHAVREPKGLRSRVTFSCFVGFSGFDHPLTLWS